MMVAGLMGAFTPTCTFTRRVGVHRLKSIIQGKVVNLLKRNCARDVDAVLDTSFIKAWSIRNPIANQKGSSDTEARVGRTGRTYGLGYKLVHRFRTDASLN